MSGYRVTVWSYYPFSVTSFCASISYVVDSPNQRIHLVERSGPSMFFPSTPLPLYFSIVMPKCEGKYVPVSQHELQTTLCSLSNPKHNCPTLNAIYLVTSAQHLHRGILSSTKAAVLLLSGVLR